MAMYLNVISIFCLTMRCLSLKIHEWTGMSHHIMKRRGPIGTLVKTHTIAKRIQQSLNEDVFDGVFGFHLISSQGFRLRGIAVLFCRHIRRHLEVSHLHLRFRPGDDIVCCVCVEEMVDDFLSGIPHAFQIVCRLFVFQIEKWHQMDVGGLGHNVLNSPHGSVFEYSAWITHRLEGCKKV